MDKGIVTAVNKHTGEIVELPVDNFKQLISAWNIAKEYEKVSEALKKQLKELVPDYINEQGKSDECDGYMFKVNHIQRMTYDKSVMRNVLDEDTYDQFLKPDKTALDRFLKENLETLGDVSTQLRKAMIPDGKAYEVIKLEKLSRDEPA